MKDIDATKMMDVDYSDWNADLSGRMWSGSISMTAECGAKINSGKRVPVTVRECTLAEYLDDGKALKFTEHNDDCRIARMFKAQGRTITRDAIPAVPAREGTQARMGRPGRAAIPERKIQVPPPKWDTGFIGANRVQTLKLTENKAGREQLGRLGFEGVELPELDGVKRRVRWCDEGDEFSHDRFHAGYLDCWRKTTRVEMPVGGTTLRITVELAANMHQTPEELTWSGIAAVALADFLEQAGYGVQVDAVLTLCEVGDENVRGEFARGVIDVVNLKQAGDVLVLDSMLLVGHPALFRFSGFASTMARPHHINGHFGQAGQTPEAFRGDIHIAKVFDEASAREVVLYELEKRAAGAREALEDMAAYGAAI